MDPIGPYEVLAQLSRGGMSTVYRARDARSGREVALKGGPRAARRGRASSTTRARKRTLTELRTLVRLLHSNVIPALDAGEHGGAPYLAVELVAGSLHEHFRGTALLVAAFGP